MQYRTPGRAGIKVSPYALGTSMYATRTGYAPEEPARIIHKALDADINFPDTADAYGQEASAYDFTWKLTHHLAVDGATYTRAAREFGQAGMVDLTVCAIVNAYNVPVPAGTQLESSAP